MDGLNTLRAPSSRMGTHSIPHLRNDLADVLVLLLALDEPARDDIHAVENVRVARPRNMTLRRRLRVRVLLRRGMDARLGRRLEDALGDFRHQD